MAARPALHAHAHTTRANLLTGGANAPDFTGIELLATGDLSLTWRTISGQTYRLEYKNNLSEPQWSTLGDHAATGFS